ncbi:MAG: alpha/beta fold hydrolase [Planctomycetota bacterium]
MRPTTLLLSVLLLPLVPFLALGMLLLTLYAMWRGRRDAQDETQLQLWTQRQRPRLVSRALWLGAESMWQSVAFARQALHALPPRRRLTVDEGDGTPVVVLSGYLENSGTLLTLARRLRADGFRVVQADFPSTLHSVERNAEWLQGLVQDLLQQTGAERVALVAHSMGGLVSRVCVHRFPELPVATVISLATPHRGTHLARLGIGQSARDMTPGSELLQAFPPHKRGQVPIHTIVSDQENIVSPSWSVVLGEGENVVLSEPVGHVGPLFLQSATRHVIRWLDEAGVRRNGARRAPAAQQQVA